jgi:undecaprenyl-diphosphatase
MLKKILINFIVKVKMINPIFWLLGVSLVSAGLFLFVGFEITEGSTGEASWVILDQRIFTAIIAERKTFLFDAMTSLTHLGSTLSTTLIVIFAALFFQFKNLVSERRVLLVAAIGCLVSISIFKNIFERARPNSEFWLTHVAGFSFPSGHSAGSFAIFGTLFYLFGRSCEKFYQRVILWFLGLLFIFSIGISRIYLGVHYPIDVLGGFLLGFTLLFLAITYDECANLKNVSFWKRRKA